MTQDELARVPEGGFKLKKCLRPGLKANDSWAISTKDGDSVAIIHDNESLARQIVGSVNAAIVWNRDFGHALHGETKLDFEFWLNYAKDNA